MVKEGASNRCGERRQMFDVGLEGNQRDETNAVWVDCAHEKECSIIGIYEN